MGKIVKLPSQTKTREKPSGQKFGVDSLRILNEQLMEFNKLLDQHFNKSTCQKKSS